MKIKIEEKKVGFHTEFGKNNEKKLNSHAGNSKSVVNEKDTILRIQNFHAGYGTNEVIIDLHMEIEINKVTAIMGPSGCGKTTLIRCINRMHELTPGGFAKGEIYLEGEELLKLNPILVRRKIGMVFQRPNPFPTMSIYDNVIAGYKLNKPVPFCPQQ